MADAQAKDAAAEVVFTPPGVTAEAEIGASLLDVAVAAGVEIDAPCGGQGRCGRCKVMVESGTVGRRANAKLTPAEEGEGYALACQTVVKGDCVGRRAPPATRPGSGPGQRRRPRRSPCRSACDWRQQPAIRKFRLSIEPPSLSDNTNDLDRLRRELARQHGIKNVVVGIGALRTLAKALRDADWDVTVTLDMRNWVLDATVPPRLLAVEPGDRTARNFGLAVDIGTTSVMVYLVDFTTGGSSTWRAPTTRRSPAATTSSRASSTRNAATVSHASSGWSSARSTISCTSCRVATSIELSEINEVTVSGNTTMTHLFLGLDPKYIREEPYIPTISLPPRVSAGELGVDVNPHASVYCMPSVGSYVGGDIDLWRALVRTLPHRQADVVHRHRHQRRDRARQQGLARLLRLLGRPGLRGRRRRAAACAPRPAPSRTCGSIADPRAELPHGRRRAAARHLRQRADRPRRASCS